MLEVEQISHDCLLAEEAFQALNRPRQVERQRVAALRFADPPVQSLWNALLLFAWLPTGFSNRQLREQLAALRGQTIEQVTPGQMTYQLRRLRLHEMIERIPKRHRYRLTAFGLRAALFFTRTYARLLRPGGARILPALAPSASAPRRAFDPLHAESDSWIATNKLAA